ncbi:cytochrome P450 [Hymenopellis radicata]|nr:cytochrome P450 [Hymenopellis radicata]
MATGLSTAALYDFASRNLIATALAVVVVGLLLRQWFFRYKGPLPPGPKGLPLIGNLLDFDPKHPWEKFAEWHEAYGPIVRISLLGHNIVILNTVEAATELLEKRSLIYSDRPQAIVTTMFTGGFLISALRWGTRWRQMRKAGHEALHGKMGESLQIAQYRGAVLFPGKVLAAGKHWREELERTPAAIILSTVYDIPPDDIKQVDEMTEAIGSFARRVILSSAPGTYWVEFFTWMQYLPSSISGWKRTAQHWFQHDSKTFEGYLADVEKRLAEGEDRPSVTRNILRDPRGCSKQQSAWILASIVGAGTDTIGGSLDWFIFAMITFPHIQAKCHEELDRVIGRDRMPKPSDKRSLPYIQATLVEVLRWEFIGPIGVAHRSMKDDWYNGYFIPEGTFCFSNVTAMNREPQFYGSDADDFNPSRFLNDKGEFELKPGMRGDGHVTYGFGPRICLGRLVANDTLFITFACALWAMKMMPPKDDAGKPILPDYKNVIAEGLVIHPAPFDAVFEPRFPDAQAIIEQTFNTL